MGLADTPPPLCPVVPPRCLLGVSSVSPRCPLSPPHRVARPALLPAVSQRVPGSAGLPPRSGPSPIAPSLPAPSETWLSCCPRAAVPSPPPLWSAGKQIPRFPSDRDAVFSAHPLPPCLEQVNPALPMPLPAHPPLPLQHQRSPSPSPHLRWHHRAPPRLREALGLGKRGKARIRSSQLPTAGCHLTPPCAREVPRMGFCPHQLSGADRLGRIAPGKGRWGWQQPLPLFFGSAVITELG